MDKIVRNVIIFAAVVLVIAGAFTVFIIAKRDSPNSNNPAASIVNPAATTGEVQDATLSVVGGNYVITPSTLKNGVPVRMTADLTTLKGCSRDVVIASLGVRKYLTPQDNVITFTPTTTGTVRIACSMNMYTGSFTVTDAGTNSGAATSTQGVSPANAPVQTATQAELSGANSPTHTCGMSNGGGCGCGG